MTIRKAEEKDIPRIIELLGQVLQIHADIRPDIFIPGTTKYTVSELTELLGKEENRICTRQCLWRNLSNIASLCLHTKMQLKNKKNSLQNKWYSANITTEKTSWR